VTEISHRAVSWYHSTMGTRKILHSDQPSDAPLTRQRITEQLRRLGFRATPLRIALLGYFFREDMPVDVRTVSEAMAEQHLEVDQVTIYRNLDHFVEKGLLKKVDLRDGRYYYEKAEACSHLICEVCGKITHIHARELENLAVQLQKKTNFLIKQPATDFFGVCEKCQKRSE